MTEEQKPKEHKNYWDLACKIFDALKEKGALVGNASIYIIEKVLEEEDKNEKTDC